MISEVIRTVFRLLILGGAAVGLDFIIQYNYRSGGTWRKHPAGRSSMMMMGSLTLVLVIFSIRILAQLVHSQLFDTISAGVGALAFVLVIYAMMYWRRLMVHLQRQAHHEHEEEHE